jgi:hypothetical protein
LTVALVDYEQRVIRAKLVYWGPADAGKTANIRHVYQRTRGETQPNLDASPPKPGCYDYLPIQLGEIRGFKVFFELFTVPGGASWSDARRSLLERADGIIFVGDSRRGRARDNASALSELFEALASWGLALGAVPFVVQCNRSDAPDAMSPAEMAAPLLAVHPRPAAVPVFAACASQGAGVFDSLKAISKLVLVELKRGSAR